MLPSLPRCRLQPCRHDVQGYDRGHQHLWFQLHHSGCNDGFLHPFLYKSVQWSLSTHRSCDRGHPYNLQHNYHRRSMYMWCSLVRCRWVRLRLRYSCDLLRGSPYRSCNRISNRCRMLPNPFRFRLLPCRRDVQDRGRGHQRLWSQLHHSVSSNGFPRPFRCKLVR